MAREVPRYRYRGNVKPSAEVHTPVCARRNAVNSANPQAAEDGNSGTLDIFDVIDSWGGWWGISARDVDKALSEIGNVDTLYVRVNSPGGEGIEGVAIGNILRAHAATVRVTVYGLAASAASGIAMAGDHVNMAPGAMMMIHDPWNIVLGNPAELRAEADVLDKLGDSYAGLYAKKAGGTPASWRALMSAETWYTAEEAVEAKLADAVAVDPAPQPVPASDTEEPEQVLIGFDMAADRFDLSVFEHAPTRAAQARTHTPAASADGSPGTHERSAAVAFTDEQLTTMRQQLGLPADADEAAIVAAQTEALAERADPPTAPAEPAPDAAAVPEGHVVVPADALEELRIAARAGQEARAQQLRQDRDDTINAAISGGYVARARADYWRQRWDRDPEDARASLEVITQGEPIFPVGGPKGRAGSDESDGGSTHAFTDDEAAQLAQLAGVPKEALING